MALSHVSTPIESAAPTAPIASAAPAAPAAPRASAARAPTEAFDQQTLDDFQEMLTKDSARQALSPNQRAQLKMLLEDGYTVPRQDITGTDKSKKEWKLEITQAWRVKQRWSLNIKD